MQLPAVLGNSNLLSSFSVETRAVAGTQTIARKPTIAARPPAKAVNLAT